MKKTIKIKSFIMVLFVITTLLFLACDAVKNESHIVASWNDISVSLSDFERVYFNSWQFKGMADSPKLRRKIARELIEKELIVREAEKKNLINERLYRKQLKRDFGSIIRRRYLEATIKDTITIPDENELKKLLIQKNKSVKVRQLFAKTKPEIEKFAEQLGQGETFENIARRISLDQPSNTVDGSIGWVKWDKVAVNVEKVLFNLEINQVSEPVKSMAGWHIFKVDSIRNVIQFNSDTDPYDIVNLGHKILNRKLEVAGAKHLKNLVLAKKLQINGRLFKKVWAHIAPNIPDSRQEMMQNTLSELETSIPPDQLGEEVIAWVDGEEFTVNDFIIEIPNLPRHLLRPNLRWAIEVAVRNKIVTEEAVKQGFANDPVVKEKHNRAEIFYKYYAAMVVADSILEHKVNLKTFYENHKENYVDYVESEIDQIIVDNRDLAIDIAKKIYNGEKFEKFTKENSSDVTSPLIVSSLDNPLGEKAAGLSQGDVFAPVRTSRGYHVIRIGNQEKHYLPYDKIKMKLARDAQENYYVELHNNLLPSGYAAHDIDYSDENLSKAFTDKSNTIF